MKNFRQIQHQLEFSGGILHLVLGCRTPVLLRFQSDIPVGSLLMQTAKGKGMCVSNRVKDDTKKCFDDLSQG